MGSVFHLYENEFSTYVFLYLNIFLSFLLSLVESRLRDAIVATAQGYHQCLKKQFKSRALCCDSFCDTDAVIPILIYIVHGRLEFFKMSNNICYVTNIAFKRLSFLCSRFCRVPITATNAPEEQDFDQFINAVKDIPQVFDTNSSAPLPAMVFNCHVGQGRTTTGMVIGCLIMCHRSGFPADAK